MTRRTTRPRDPEWPSQLGEPTPHDSPRELRLEGLPLNVEFGRTVAIVGARYPTAAGLETAREMSRGFAEAGFTVVSGLAMGIDSAAHRGCLEVGGYTVAVLGTGLDVVYPDRNAALRKQIFESGTLVTEYHDQMPPVAHNFPRRNRIIARLARGVVFVEGGERSGGKITARLALEAGRNVYAVPGSVRNPMAIGPNEVIRRQEASLVTNFTHVLDELAPGLAWEIPEPGLQTSPVQLEEDDRAVLFLLDESPVPPERIRKELGLTMGKAALTLARLESRGWIVRKPAGYVLSRSGLRTREVAAAVENE